MAEEILMTVDEAIEYVRNNVKVGDTLEISYNRIYAPGEVLGITEEDEVTGEGLRVNLQLNGEILNQAVEIDFKEIYDDLLEMNHITEDKEITIEIDFWILFFLFIFYLVLLFTNKFLYYDEHNHIEVKSMKTIKLSVDEAVKYLKENIKIHDGLEISYNRIFAEGEILNVDFSEYFGKPGFKILLSLDESHLNPTIEIDVYEIQEDLIEFTHTPKDGSEVIEVTVV